MGQQLRTVIPPESPGVLRRLYSAMAAGRIARFVSRHVNWKLDPILLRLTGGRFSSTLMIRSALLETRGARSGELRRNVVIYVSDGDGAVITASNAGAPRHPAWFHNLRKNPDVTFGGRAMTASLVEDPAERKRLEALCDRAFPTFANYRTEAAAVSRTIPIIRLTPRT